MKKTHRQPRPNLILLQAALDLLPPSGDGPQRFRMKAYDGGLLRLPTAPYPVVVDLSGMRQSDQVKALLHHKADMPVGHMDRVTIGDSIETEGLLSVPENAAKITAAQAGGFRWEASIGATVDPGTFEFVERGQSAQANGRSFAGPVLIARGSLLKEVSFVGIGAGDNTCALAASYAVPISPESLMDPVSTLTKKKKPQPPADAPGAELQKLTSEIRVLQASLQTQADALKAQSEALQAERDQLLRERTAASVERIAAQHGASSLDILASLRTQAAEGKITENEIELQILRASHGNRLAGIQTIRQRKDGPAVPHVMEAAMLITAGWSETDVGKQFDEKTVNEAIAANFAGFGPRGLLIEYLQAHGRPVLGGRVQDDDVMQAMRLCEMQQLQASGGGSTLSLPGILSNVARKEMLRGYEVFQPSILKIAKRATTNDYKPFYMYRLNTDGLLKQMGPDGEMQSMELKEDGFSSRVYPWGRKLAMNHVMFKNDDAGAFSDLARLFGVTAARTLEQQGYTVLLADQSTFWTTAKGNRLSTGAGTALSLTSLGDLDGLLTSIKDSTGQPITVTGKYLVTAPKDKVLARSLFVDTHLNMAATGSSTAVVERGTGNPWAGQFEPLTSPYLANGAVDQANGTQFLLTSDPELGMAPLVAAFLDGQSTPKIRQWTEMPGKLGLQWDIWMSFGFNKHDDKGSAYSPGQ